VNYPVTKKELGQIVNDLAERYPKVQVAHTLDNLKAAGFHWATRSSSTRRSGAACSTRRCRPTTGSSTTR